MNKCLKFTIGAYIITNLPYLGKSHFTGKNNSLCTHFMPRLYRGIVCIVSLSADMYFKLRSNSFANIESSQIRNNYRICTHIVNFFEIPFHFGKVTVMRNNICCDINLFPHAVCKFYSLTHFFGSKIIRGGTQRKTFSPYIHRIGAIFQCDFQFIKISGRCQKFNFLHNKYPFIFLRREPHHPR